MIALAGVAVISPATMPSSAIAGAPTAVVLLDSTAQAHPRVASVKRGRISAVFVVDVVGPA